MNAPMSFEGSEKPGLARERLVVIGNGMAGCRAVEEILARDPGQCCQTGRWPVCINRKPRRHLS